MADPFAQKPGIPNIREASPVLISYLDEAVREKLPENHSFLGIYPHGHSMWGQTARIDTVDVSENNNKTISYFLKVHTGESRKDLLKSEFFAMNLIHSKFPDLAPKPLAHGAYRSEENVWFFLSEFRDMVDKMPEPDEFIAQISRFHKGIKNPEGKFGWQWPIFAGVNGRRFPLTDSWEKTFSEGLWQTFMLEERIQGNVDDEWKSLKAALFSKVIPRLLRPLETGDRSIQPVLVHGDLWLGNTGRDTKTNRTIIFDPCPMWAHHEMELAPWFCPRHKINLGYIRKYGNQSDNKSQPQDDFMDRIQLYCIHFDIQASSNYRGGLSPSARENMRLLVRKFSDGYEGWSKSVNGASQIPSTQLVPAYDAGAAKIAPVNHLLLEKFRKQNQEAFDKQQKLRDADAESHTEVAGACGGFGADPELILKESLLTDEVFNGV